MRAAVSEEQSELRKRLAWLTGGRLLIATLLLGGTLLLNLRNESGAQGFTPRVLLFAIAATYFACLVFSIWLPRATKLETLATLQIGWDLTLTTALVYVGGGAASGFAFLYGASVLMAALVVGPQAARLATVVSLLLYLSLALSLTNGWIDHPPDQPVERYLLSAADATFTMLVNIFGLLLVAFLAATLATRLRQAGGQLREATAQAAELARLNEDIIRSLSSGLLTTDERRMVQTINPAGLDIFHARAADIVGRPVEQFFVDDREAPELTRHEASGKRADGSVFPVGYSRTPLLNAEGRCTGELFLFQDLTELVALRETAERAERLAALGRLAAALAHEIRNPLGSISGSVQLVHGSEVLEQEDRKLLGIVLREVDRLNGLVNTMLQFGRTPPPRRTRTPLNALTREVVEVARRDHQSANLSIVVRCPERETYASIDGDQIKQVIWNLLSNALTHAPASSEIRIEVREEGKSVVWSIEDDGPGVPAEARGQLFDMFYSKRPHGVGLGLALVEQIVRAHGGDVRVVSPPGRGAKFEVRLSRSEPIGLAS